MLVGAQSYHFVPLALRQSLQLTFLLSSQLPVPKSWLLCAWVSPSPRSFRSPCSSHLIAPFKKNFSPGYSLGAVYVCSFVCSLSRYTPTVYQALFWVRACIHAQNRQKSLPSPRKCVLHTTNKLGREMLPGSRGQARGLLCSFPRSPPILLSLPCIFIPFSKLLPSSSSCSALSPLPSFLLPAPLTPP